MGHRIVDPASLTAGPGPHPAASPFDKRVGELLGLTAFQVYQVELPAGAQTVRHDHRADEVEDLYVITAGSGWLIVDDEPVPIREGNYIAVSLDSVRQIRAGDGGLVFTAICAPAADRSGTGRQSTP